MDAPNPPHRRNALPAPLSLRPESPMEDWDLGLPVPAGRWDGISRSYGTEDVLRLRGTVRIEHTLAEMGSRQLWSPPYA